MPGSRTRSRRPRSLCHETWAWRTRRRRGGRGGGCTRPPAPALLLLPGGLRHLTALLSLRLPSRPPAGAQPQERASPTLLHGSIWPSPPLPPSHRMLPNRKSAHHPPYCTAHSAHPLPFLPPTGCYPTAGARITHWWHLTALLTAPLFSPPSPLQNAVQPRERAPVAQAQAGAPAGARDPGGANPPPLCLLFIAQQPWAFLTSSPGAPTAQGAYTAFLAPTGCSAGAASSAALCPLVCVSTMEQTVKTSKHGMSLATPPNACLPRWPCWRLTEPRWRGSWRARTTRCVPATPSSQHCARRTRACARGSPPR